MPRARRGPGRRRPRLAGPRSAWCSQGEGSRQDLTVREMLDHFAGYHATPRPTTELVAAVGLDEKAGTRVGRLSGGQRRRSTSRSACRAARAGLPRRADDGHGPGGPPAVLGADPRLRADGTTVLLTTHYLDEAGRAGRPGRRRRRRSAGRGRAARRARRASCGDWPRSAGPRTARCARCGPRRRRPVLRDLLAASVHGDVPGLTVTRPSLEDVYLQLVGAAAHRLRGRDLDDRRPDHPSRPAVGGPDRPLRAWGWS